MIDTKELRQLTQAATLGGWYVKRGNHIYGCKEVTNGEEKWHPVIACTDDDEVNVNFEANAAFIAAANPAAITELLDRLEVAEKERDALRSLVVMRFDLDHPPQFTQGYDTHELTEPVTAEHCRWFVAEIERLRAKIEAMEKQEPAGKFIRHPSNGLWEQDGYGDNPDARPLYALPGAKGE